MRKIMYSLFIDYKHHYCIFMWNKTSYFVFIDCMPFKYKSILLYCEYIELYENNMIIRIPNSTLCPKLKRQGLLSTLSTIYTIPPNFSRKNTQYVHFMTFFCLLHMCVSSGHICVSSRLLLYRVYIFLITFCA